MFWGGPSALADFIGMLTWGDAPGWYDARLWRWVGAGHEFGESEIRGIRLRAFAIPTHDAKARHGWGTQLSGNADIRNGWVGHLPADSV